jgi:hypothetical protein
MCLALCCSNLQTLTGFSARPVTIQSRKINNGKFDSFVALQQPVFMPQQQITTTQSIPTFSNQITVDPNVVAWATRAFFKYGGRPTVNSNAMERRIPFDGRDEFGFAVINAPAVLYSNSHEGFCLYLARLLRPIWLETITKEVTETRPGPTPTSVKRQVCKYTKDQLVDLQESLANLRDFLNKSKYLLQPV